MRIAICDEDALSQEQLTQAVREWDPMQCPECFSSGAELLKAAAGGVFDIVFLDTGFSGEKGLDVAVRLRKMSPETGIVFLAASGDYAIDAWSVNALHYLVKPVTAEDVAEAFRRLELIRSRPQRPLFRVAGRENITVYLDDISYIASDGHRKALYLTDGQVLRVRISFRELADRLDHSFLRLNKGTIVNMEHIRTISRDYCLLRDGTRFTFPRRGRTHIRNTYDEFVYSRLFREGNGG